MSCNILWIDDSPTEREASVRMIGGIDGVRLWTAVSSHDADRILRGEQIHCVITDILRRDADGEPTDDDGYEFFARTIRPRLPTVPVIFHTKNMPGSFAIDSYSQYLSKWDSEEKKAIELEARISAAVRLYSMSMRSA
jgi:CheY-like chemotaxis protein